MAKFSLETDFKNFKYGIIELKAAVRRTSSVAVKAAMERHLDDCLNKVPKCPRDTNALANSHKVLPVMHLGSQFVGTLKVSRPYAAALHEGFSRRVPQGFTFKHAPDEGAKWIESKMIAFGNDYLRIAANELSIGLSRNY